ncbi:MAG: tripartite tricarboxylate transporter TctB family protein [Burkholderiaceae bacterium]
MRAPVPPEDRGPSLSVRSAEIGVALFTALLGSIVMFDSANQGMGWTDSGPGAGYFPFRIGLIMVLASAGIVGHTVWRWRTQGVTLVAPVPLKRVLSVFLPMCAYVVAMRLLGMVIASAVFIAWFMLREKGTGRHALWRVAAVSVGAPLASWLIFERWFQVPLYTGPLLGALGLGR